MTPVLSDREATSVTTHLLTMFTQSMPVLNIHPPKNWPLPLHYQQLGTQMILQIRMDVTVNRAAVRQAHQATGECVRWQIAEAFDWCVQQRVLKQRAVWGLPTPSQSACSPVYLLSTSAFPPSQAPHTGTVHRSMCDCISSVSQHVWDTETEVHYMCRNERARCAHLSQQTKTKNNTSFSGTQQLGDRGRDARVSDGYLPFTVAVERCQMSTHSKRICNANESARVPSGCSNLCRTHNVLASSPLWPKVILWTGSKGY